MDDVKVTCPTCRGAREMMKLGGMMGKCNLCLGDGRVDLGAGNEREGATGGLKGGKPRLDTY